MNLPDIYFLPEWGRITQELVNGEACVFDFNNTLGHVYYSFLKRKVPDLLGYGTFYDIVTPYGYSGPIILNCDKVNKECLISAYDDAFRDFCFQENIIAEYVMFNPWLKNHLDFEKIYTLKYKHHTLFTDLTVNDVFMEEYHARLRTKIRKAEKSGIQLECDYTGRTIGEFYHIYQFTIEKYNASNYYNYSIAFLTNLIKKLDNMFFIINAKFEDKYISSIIFLEYGDYLHYYLVGNDPSYYLLNANSLIIKEAAILGQKKGKKQLHFGGTYNNELFNFKHQFTRKGICDYYIGEKIRNEAIYNKLVEVKLKKGDIKNNQYFPLYRG